MNSKYIVGMLLIMLTATCFAQDTIYMRNDQRIACNIVEITSTEVKYKKLELSDGPLYIENKSLVAQIKYKNGFIDVFQEVKPPVVPSKRTEDDYVQDRTHTKGGKDDYVNSRRDRLLVIGTNHYLYGDKRLNENKMQQLLLSVNDPQITKNIKRAKLDKGLKYVGFLAIPLFMGGIACAMQINPTKYNINYPDQQNKEFIAPTVVCMVGAVAAFSASIYFGIDRKVKNAKAIRLYQQKYEGQ